MAEGEVGIIVQGQSVVMRHPEPTEYTVFSAEQARVFAEGLARAAHEAYTGIKTQHNGESYISRQLLSKLQKRVDLVIASMHREGRSSQQIAEQVVDIVLRDVS